MENFYFIDYFNKNNVIDPALMDCLKAELDQNIYYYGDQFKHPKEFPKKRFRGAIRKLKWLFALYKIIQNRKILTNKKIILSNAYFSMNHELKQIGYQVYSPSWRMAHDRNILSDFKIFSASEAIKHKLETSNFNELISAQFLSSVKKFEENLKDFFTKKQLSALIVPNDMIFFENISIRICKDINVPSFVFLHGLPGLYNHIDGNRSNYLVVWGDRIKENFINAGISPDKIFVSGHPYYKEFKKNELKFSLENILIITKSMNGGQHGDKVILSDRGNLILYLYSIEKILKKLGVKSVRFRAHPSENAEWYSKFLNSDFYKIDNANLEHSIKNSSLVIGPTSTVFLESLYHGVNYLVYEPSVHNTDLINYELAPPFDGTEPKVPVAKNEEELSYLLKNKEKVNISFISEYIKTPFDLSFIKSLIP